MTRMRRWKRYLLVLMLLLGITGTVYARDVRQGEDCVIPEDEIIQGTLFILCEHLEMRGTVTGDVVGLALRGVIAGEVQSSVYVIGGDILLGGKVDGDVHFAGLKLTLTGDVPPPIIDSTQMPDTPVVPVADTTPAPPMQLSGSIRTLALDTRLMSAELGGGITTIGYQLIVSSPVGGEINFWGGGVLLDSTVGGSIYANVGDPASDGTQIETLLLPLSFPIQLNNPGLTITGRGRVGGTLNYTGPVRAEIPARLARRTVYTPTTVALPTLEEPGTLNIYLDGFIRSMTMLITLGLIGLAFVPELMRTPLTNMRYRPVSSFSVGMLAFLLSFPIVLIIAILSLIIFLVLNAVNLGGVALAFGIMLAILNFSGVSIFYFVAIFAARALVAFALGRFMLRIVRGNVGQDARSFIISMLVGSVLLALAISLPIVGWVFNAGAVFLGLGTILTAILEKFRTIREAPPAAQPAWYPLSSSVLRPRAAEPAANTIPEIITSAEPTETLPAIEPKPNTKPPSRRILGTDNLPQGFDWGFFDEDGN